MTQKYDPAGGLPAHGDQPGATGPPPREGGPWYPSAAPPGSPPASAGPGEHPRASPDGQDRPDARHDRYDPDDDATAVRRPAGSGESSRANRGWWDRNADDYQREHGAFLGDRRFVWGPEGLDEERAELLGPAGSLAGRRIVELGAGAAQCSRWLAGQGARVVALDLSHRQLQHALRIGAEGVGLVQADAEALPFWDGSFDLACSAYGALPFVADPVRVHREVWRVLRPGGRWVFSVTHPLRWALPDEPGPEGLRVTSSYFDRTPYVEQDERGRAVYVEHHRTLGDWVSGLVAGGFRLLDLVEPQWPGWNRQEWGGWSPLRGRLVPGTAIFVCERSADAG